MTDKTLIRNFSIIAHIDHGKSTLADRLLELTGALTAREMSDQVLDAMDLERERGITIKAHSVRLNYARDDGQDYVFNLIDTPGHVDFSYEVSRSLSACEGALLVVDASQGVEAQTLANTYLALDHHLEIVPVINKIDLPGADPHRIKDQIENIIGLDAKDAILASAKEGIGTDEILEAIVHRLPPPRGEYDKPLKALIFDSWFDSYRGVIVLVRVIDGTIRKGMKIRLVATQQSFTVEQVGVITPKFEEVDELSVGEVGFVVAGIKRVADTKIGDTITEEASPTTEPFPGFQEIKPMVFAGLYPTDNAQYEDLREALEKLSAQRFFVLLRAGYFRRAGLRLPLRLPGSPAHGDRPGTPRTRVQPVAHHHRPGRALSDHDDGEAKSSRSTTLPSSRPSATSRNSKNR